MNSRTIRSIHAEAAPKAVGPYSHAVVFKDTVYTSGQIPLDPASGDIVSEDITRQALQVMDNLKCVLEASGSDMKSIIKLTCYLTDMGDFPAVNAVFEQVLEKPYPARSCVEVRALPKQVKIEIDAAAAVIQPA